MNYSFALGIPHTPWRLDRRASLDRLERDLGIDGDRIARDDVQEVRIFGDREANWSWAGRMWHWAIETGASHLLSLQDDVLVAPDFWRHLRAMVTAVPSNVIGLESVHPIAKEVSGHWYTTPDMLIGVGYVVPVDALRGFLTWRAFLRKGAIESINEDDLLGLWCFVSGHRIWHPVPTIIDHDTTLPSTYGNDKHQARRPEVTWQTRALPERWETEASASTRRFYDSTPRKARRWVPGATEGDFQRWMGR